MGDRHEERDVEEHGAGSCQEGDGQQVTDGEESEQPSDRHGREQRGAQQICRDEHAASVPAVDPHARR